MKFTTALTTLLLIVNSTFAQKPPIKYGKPEKGEVEMEIYEKDPSAAAVILCDFGVSRIDYGREQFEVIFERTLRVKILKKEGLEWGDLEIPYYSPKIGGKERISSIKGITFNLENGKVVSTKLSKEGIFDSQENEYWKETKVSMPQVREGSVIDITYSISSPYLFNFRDWQFQYTIPVKWSEYRARFIEYFDFKRYMQGYVPMQVDETSSGVQSFTVVQSSEIKPGMGGGRTSSSSETFTAKYMQHRWAVGDVPAFKEEPYISTTNNYVSRINFELAGERWPNRPYKNLLGSWSKINEQMITSEHFYRRVQGSNFLQKEVDVIIAGTGSDDVFAKVSAIHSYVRRNVKWNGFYAKFANNTFRKILDDQKGTTADVNLLLTSMLKKAGVDAEPVLVSTRNHGFIRKQFPIADQFNSVISRVKIGDQLYLLDATDAYLPAGALPERCLNGQGWVVSKENAGWISLEPTLKTKTQTSIVAELTNDDQLVGTIERQLEGYAARNERAKFFRDSLEYKQKLSKGYDWEISELALENARQLSEPLVVKNSFELDLEPSGNLTYVSPVMIKMWDENPFKVEKRDYPVDFASPISETVLVKFKLPPGTIVEESPESKVIALPNKGGRFTYNVTVSGSEVTILNKLDINKTIFNQEEYPYLREFVEQYLQSQQQVFVLKKT